MPPVALLQPPVTVISHTGGEAGGKGGEGGDDGGGGGDDGDGTAPPPQAQHMVLEEKSVSSSWPQKKGFVYSEQPLDHLSVAAPSRSVHPDSDRARMPSASVLNTFGAMGSADFRGGESRTCPIDGTTSTMRAPPWSDRSPNVLAAKVAGSRGGLEGGIRTARSTGNHCGGHATPRTGSCVFELRGKVAAGLGC